MVCKLCFQNKKNLSEAATTVPLLSGLLAPETIPTLEQILATAKNMSLYTEAKGYVLTFLKAFYQQPADLVLARFFQLPIFNQKTTLEMVAEYRYFCHALLIYGQKAVNYALDRLNQPETNLNQKLLAAEILFQTQNPLLYLETLCQHPELLNLRHIRTGLLDSVASLRKEKHPAYPVWLQKTYQMFKDSTSRVPLIQFLVEKEIFDLANLPVAELRTEQNIDCLLSNSYYKEAFQLALTAPLPEQIELLKKQQTYLGKMVRVVNSNRTATLQHFQDCEIMLEMLLLQQNTSTYNSHFHRRVRKVLDHSFKTPLPSAVIAELLEHLSPSLVTKILTQKTMENVQSRHLGANLCLVQTINDVLECRHLNEPEVTLQNFEQVLPLREQKYNFNWACYNFWQRQQEPSKGLPFLVNAIQIQISVLKEKFPTKALPDFPFTIRDLTQPPVQKQIETLYQEWIRNEAPDLDRNGREDITSYFWQLACQSQNSSLGQQIADSGNLKDEQLFQTAATEPLAYQILWQKIKTTPARGQNQKQQSFEQKFIVQTENNTFLKQFSLPQRAEVKDFLLQKIETGAATLDELKKALWQTEVYSPLLVKKALQDFNDGDGIEKILAANYLLAVKVKSLSKKQN